MLAYTLFIRITRPLVIDRTAFDRHSCFKYSAIVCESVLPVVVRLEIDTTVRYSVHSHSVRALTLILKRVGVHLTAAKIN